MPVATSVLAVRDVPDDVRAALNEHAAAAGTSMNSYLLDVLSREAAGPTTAQVLARAARRAERARASSAAVIGLGAGGLDLREGSAPVGDASPAGPVDPVSRAARDAVIALP